MPIYLIYLCLWLAACQAVESISTSPAAGAGSLPVTSSSQWMQLALGTLMLDEKDLPIDSAQAAGPPGDFGGMPGGGGPPSAQTTQVASGSKIMSLGVSADLLEEVIKYLQARQ